MAGHEMRNSAEKAETAPLVAAARQSGNGTDNDHESSCVGTYISEIPGMIVSAVIQLQEGVVYGLLFFPVTFGKYQTIGISMFFISCAISQLSMALISGFHCGIPQPILEVIPFVAALATSITSSCNDDQCLEDMLPTVLVSIGLSSILHGLGAGLLGALNLGSLVHLFPPYVMNGILGGIGFFLIEGGFETATGLEWTWTSDFFSKLFTIEYGSLWATCLGGWLLSQLCLLVLPGERAGFFQDIRDTLCPKASREDAAPAPKKDGAAEPEAPKHTCSWDEVWDKVRNYLPLIFMVIIIPAVFYSVAVGVYGMSLDALRDKHWLLPEVAGMEWYTYFEYAYRIDQVHWDLVEANLGTIALVAFYGLFLNVMNIMSLSAVPGAYVGDWDKVAMKKELYVASGFNIVSGAAAAFAPCTTVSNSRFFLNSVESKKLDRLGSLTLGLIYLGFFFIGPGPSMYLPRCMAGFVAFALGYDLASEYLGKDAYNSMVLSEYVIMWTIVAVMLFWGFVQGLVVGLTLCACTVTYNCGKFSSGTVLHRAADFKSFDFSSRHPGAKDDAVLNSLANHACVIQPNGALFFGNCIQLQGIAENVMNTMTVDCVILNLKYVNFIDSAGMALLGTLRECANDNNVLFLMCDADDANEGWKELGKSGTEYQSNDVTRVANGSIALLNGVVGTCSEANNDTKKALEESWNDLPPNVQKIRRKFMAEMRPGANKIPFYFDSLDQALAISEDFMLELHAAGAYSLKPEGHE